MQTDGTLPRDQVLKTAELQEGMNIFSVNLAKVHDRLQQLPQIDEVQVDRRMPNEIDIKITERKPIAWITSEKTVANPFVSDAAFLVDARGILMKEKKLLPEYLSLPLITGCSSEALVPGKEVDSFEAKTALALLRLTTTQFHADAFPDSRGRCLEGLLPARDGQESHARSASVSMTSKRRCSGSSNCWFMRTIRIAKSAR